MENIGTSSPQPVQPKPQIVPTNSAGLRKVIIYSLAIFAGFLLIAFLGVLSFIQSRSSTNSSAITPLKIILILLEQLLPILIVVGLLAGIGLLLKRIFRKTPTSIQQGIETSVKPAPFGSKFLYVYLIFIIVFSVFSLPALVFSGFFLIIFMPPLLIPILVVFLIRKLKSNEQTSNRVLWITIFSGLGLLLYATPFIVLSIFRASSGY